MGVHEYKGSVVPTQMLPADETKATPVASTWYPFTDSKEIDVTKFEEAALILKVKSDAADIITFELEIHDPTINGWAKACSTYNVTCDGSLMAHKWVANLNLRGVSKVRLSRFQSDGTGNLSDMNAAIVSKV